MCVETILRALRESDGERIPPTVQYAVSIGLNNADDKAYLEELNNDLDFGEYTFVEVDHQMNTGLAPRSSTGPTTSTTSSSSNTTSSTATHQTQHHLMLGVNLTGKKRKQDAETGLPPKKKQRMTPAEFDAATSAREI